MNDEERAIKREEEMELVRRELERRSFDTIRVYNPLETAFHFKWNSYPFNVPAKSYAEMERYRADIFAKKIIEYMIGKHARLQGEELKALREKQLGRTYLDKYEENMEIWERVPKLTDPQLIDEYGKTVIIGLVREYGMDEIPEQEEAPVVRKESPFDGLNKLMDRRIIDDKPMEAYKADE